MDPYMCAFCDTVIIREGFAGSRYSTIVLPCPWGTTNAADDVALHPACYVELVNIVRKILRRPPYEL